MRFDDIITKVLEGKDEVGSKESVVVKGGQLSWFDDLERLELENKIISGTVVNVMIELMEYVLEETKRNYSAPSSLEECDFISIRVDNLTSPKVGHIQVNWKAEETSPAIVFFYRFTSTSLVDLDNDLDADRNYRILHHTSTPHTISLKQLRELQQNELSDKAMKGHELEDLYNL